MDEYGVEVLCPTLFDNVTSKRGSYCPPAWDTFYCWPSTAAGAIASELCTVIFSFLSDSPVDRDNTGEARAYRVCNEDGEWLWSNWTNYTECLSLLDVEFSAPLAVGYILLICSSISLLTLSVTIFIFCYFESLQCSRLRVHKNLVVAMMVNSSLLIVVSSSVIFGHTTQKSNKLVTETEWVCKSIMSLKMYASASSINWMFVEGLLLHSRITISIFEQDAPFKLYYFIGWGIPAVLVVIWSVLMLKKLPTPCWQGYGKSPYIWVIAAPMLAALIVNTVFLLNILRILMTKHKAKMSVETLKIRKAAKATGLLFPLLGITNLLFCINPRADRHSEEAYMITNAILQSSQGIFVSVLYCFFNSEVQTVIRHAYNKSMVNRSRHFIRQKSRGSSHTTILRFSDSQFDGAKKIVVRTVLDSRMQATNCPVTDC